MPALGAGSGVRDAGREEVVDMSDRTAEKTATLTGDLGDNAVELRGRVSSAPVERELPSGAAISTFRMSVARARTAMTAMTAGSSQSVDWVDCTAWTARTRRSVGAWTVGDQVEVSGALRRRFYRAGDAATTRLEVEVLGARRARPRADPPER
jgi:single-strand DNA-binding protein